MSASELDGMVAEEASAGAVRDVDARSADDALTGSPQVRRVLLTCILSGQTCSEGVL